MGVVNLITLSCGNVLRLWVSGMYIDLYTNEIFTMEIMEIILIVVIFCKGLTSPRFINIYAHFVIGKFIRHSLMVIFSIVDIILL